MVKTGRYQIAWILFATILCLSPPTGAADLPLVRIGMVIDGPWERNDEIRTAFEREILDLTRGDFDVRFPPGVRIEADWTVGGVRAALDRLLDDPEVHIVIAAGVLASNEACRRGALPKPVVAPIVLSPQIQGIPFKNGTSGVSNLVYITFPSDFRRDIQAFREVVSFSRLALLTNSVIAEAIPELRENVIAAIRELDIDIQFVPVAPSLASPLANLPPNTEAVFVSPLLGFSQDQVGRIISELIERRLPSFSAMGTNEVKQGMLMGLAPEFNIPRLSRRLGLNVQRILLGEDPSTFQVVFTRGEHMTINMATARAIGVYPSWKVITEAELIEQERKEAETERTLSLPDAVREAVAVNLDLAAQKRAVSAGAEEVNSARSALLPQVAVSGLGVVIDDDIGSPQQAERSTSGSAKLTQVIFSERAWANVAIQRRLQESREYERDRVRLDIVQEAATTYLNVLRSKTFERIQKDNVKVSRSNLELARVRQAIGSSGPGEVYRWESQIATDRRAVIQANAQRNLAEMALNRTLHRPLEESFSAVEVGLDDPRLIGQRRLFSYIDNKWDFEIFRAFMVEEGFAHSPELRQLDASIAAQERALRSARRAFFSPTIAAQGEATRVLSRGGVGSDLPPFGGNLNWNIGVNVSLPLFSGGSRTAELRKAREALWGLRLQRESVAEKIEQRVRSGLHVMGASYAAIQLSVDAAEAARKNRDLTTDAYSRGVVSILDLLDAQNAALASERAAANAVHDFLIDMIEAERAVGRITFLMTPSEIDALFERLDAFFADARAKTE